MASTVVIYSKQQAEVHQFVADFTGQLLTGESFIGAGVSISVFVFSGSDSQPSAILVNPFTLIGNVVSQGLQQGIPGVVYEVVCHVTTNLSRGLTINTYLAVLPNNYPAAGAFITYYFTSNLYPILVTDTAHSFATISSALVDTVIKFYSFADTARSTASITSALVNSITQNYAFTDTARMVTPQITSAMVTTIVLNYAFSDTAHSNAAIVSAMVTTVVINYNFSDTAHSTAAITSAMVT